MQVATAEGRLIEVHRSANGTVTIRHYVLSAGSARELIGLLDQALKPDCPVGLGSVTLVEGRPLFVKRWPHAVSITKNRTGHGGWSFVLRDQVQALRDAVVGDAPV